VETAVTETELAVATAGCEVAVPVPTIVARITERVVRDLLV
jgi:hypothetical protein